MSLCIIPKLPRLTKLCASDPSEMEALEYTTNTLAGEALTLQEVQDEDPGRDTPGGHLDPPLEEEREEQNPHKALPGQGCPRTLWLGLTERRAWGGKRKGTSRNKRMMLVSVSAPETLKCNHSPRTRSTSMRSGLICPVFLGLLWIPYK